MPSDCRPEPRDAYPFYEPTREDWDEFFAYVVECEQREEEEAFEEANRELSAIEEFAYV